ncbi:MAG: hypothetical protein Q9225_000764 [Loekoesia sp. 1 TL-2023]
MAFPSPPSPSLRPIQVLTVNDQPTEPFAPSGLLPLPCQSTRPSINTLKSTSSLLSLAPEVLLLISDQLMTTTTLSPCSSSNCTLIFCTICNLPLINDLDKISLVAFGMAHPFLQNVLRQCKVFGWFTVLSKAGTLDGNVRYHPATKEKFVVDQQDRNFPGLPFVLLDMLPSGRTDGEGCSEENESAEADETDDAEFDCGEEDVEDRAKTEYGESSEEEKGLAEAAEIKSGDSDGEVEELVWAQSSS